mmetsp:Transcript_23665/g.68116  ORF Transcript_23665/g.68116 Transcript_23665/m.68116 type:complete len:87 (+) Transcript_23665:137-397(+)
MDDPFAATFDVSHNSFFFDVNANNDISNAKNWRAFPFVKWDFLSPKKVFDFDWASSLPPGWYKRMALIAANIFQLQIVKSSARRHQ